MQHFYDKAVLSGDLEMAFNCEDVDAYVEPSELTRLDAECKLDAAGQQGRVVCMRLAQIRDLFR